MKKQLLLLLFLVTVTFGYAQELVVVDLTTPNEITISATTNASAATVSGGTTTGFYLENFFANANDQALVNMLITGTLTAASTTTDNSPSIFRGTGGTDPGLNVWSYTAETTTSFTAGQLAFTGQGTWSLTTDEYNAMLTAPTSGDIYFPADTVDDLTSATPATFIGTYSVTLPNLGVSDLEFYDFEYYPNPVRDVLNISSQQVIAQVDIYNMLGQNVSVQKLNALEGTVNTTSLSTGTYFLRTTFKDGTTGTFKLVKE